MPQRLTKLARLPLLMLDQAEQHGMDRYALMRAAELDPAIIDDPDCRVPMSSLLALWEAIASANPGIAVGLRIGSTIRAKQLGIVGYAMYFSDDLGQAMQRFSRYCRVLSEAVQCTVEREGRSVALVFEVHPSLQAVRHPVEVQLAAILSVARDITRTALVPEEVRLPFADAIEPGLFRDVFRCPIRYNNLDPAIIYRPEQLQLSVRTSDSTLSGYLDQLAEAAVDSLGDSGDDLIAEVRRTLWSDLPGGKPDVARTASALGLTSRTLQRRLQRRGTSFAEILDVLRQEIATELVANETLAIAEIAYLLGYSEPSAFQRAFRRWHGRPARQYRAA